VETGGKTEYRPIESDFFRAFDNLLGFYETGKGLAPKEETLSVIALIEAGKRPWRNLSGGSAYPDPPFDASFPPSGGFSGPLFL
jgi:hypothetical protein